MRPLSLCVLLAATPCPAADLASAQVSASLWPDELASAGSRDGTCCAVNANSRVSAEIEGGSIAGERAAMSLGRLSGESNEQSSRAGLGQFSARECQGWAPSLPRGLSAGAPTLGAGGIGIVTMIAGRDQHGSPHPHRRVRRLDCRKRGLTVVASATVASGALAVSLFPAFVPVAMAQTAWASLTRSFRLPSPPCHSALWARTPSPSESVRMQLLLTQVRRRRRLPGWQAGSSRRAQCSGSSPRLAPPAPGQHCKLMQGRSTTLSHAALITLHFCSSLQSR
jgi:hypothetical protein